MPSFVRFHDDPFTELDRLFDDASDVRIFYSLPSVCLRQGRPQAHRLNSFRPRLDLHESKDSNIITATFELPGLASNDVTIEMHHNRLTVSGESTTNASEEGMCTVGERRYGKFSRTLQLPVGTKPEDVKAKMENGLLTLTFSKSTPEEQPQRIAVL